MKRVVILGLFLFLGSAGLTAQMTKEKASWTPKTVVENSNCELKLLEMDALIQQTGRDFLMIVISHLGKDEDERFANRRLHNAKVFFTGTESKYNRPLETVVTGEGVPVDGEGYLDLYIRGELELRISFKRNRDLFVRPCALNFPTEKYCSTAFEKLFYPCNAKN